MGAEAPTLTSRVCLLLPEESRVHQQHHQPRTLWVPTCRSELCPGCVTCCASCKRNGPSVCRSSPKRRQENWARRQCQVGDLPQPRGTPQCPILSSGGSGLSSGPSGLSMVGRGLSTPSAVRSGTWSQWTWKLHTSFLWTASAFSPSASAHTVYQGELLLFASL